MSTTPSQHLPERQYPCASCKQDFNSAEEFSNHFEREGFHIVGCKTSGRVAKVERVAN